MEQGRMVDPGEVDPDPYPNLTFNGKTTGVNPDLTVKKKLGSGFNHRKTLGSDRIRIRNPDYNQSLPQRTQIPSYGLICVSRSRFWHHYNIYSTRSAKIKLKCQSEVI